MLRFASELVDVAVTTFKLEAAFKTDGRGTRDRSEPFIDCGLLVVGHVAYVLNTDSRCAHHVTSPMLSACGTREKGNRMRNVLALTASSCSSSYARIQVRLLVCNDALPK
jgi:hypothetical protein